MEITGILVFAGALFIAAVSPGPAVAALIARVLARGVPGAPAFSVGLAVGDVVWLSCAILGLAILAQTFAVAFAVLKYAGAAYLLYLAWRMWRAPTVIASGAPPTAESPLRLFLAGLALTLGNPKTMVFYLALLPNLIDLQRVSLLGFTALAAITLAVLATVFGGYIALASRARRLFTSARSVRLLNRGSGAVMAGGAAAIAAR